MFTRGSLLASLAVLFPLANQAQIIEPDPLTNPGAPPNLIVNGSFEVPGPSNEYRLLPSGSTYLTGWTTILNGAELFSKHDIGGIDLNVTIADGFRAVDLPPFTAISGGGIEQAFATAPGSQYQVSFDLATVMLAGKDGTGHVQVDVAGTTHLYNLINLNTDWVWESHSFTFTAVGTSSTLSFKSFDNANLHSASLDNVRVQNFIVPVPEPTAIISLSTTLVLSWLVLRRKED